jgi:hypothetical protein
MFNVCRRDALPMKRKWEWLILLLCLPLLLFAGWLWMVGGRQIPVDVIGDVPEKDVAEIVVEARRAMRHDIFPNFSWKSLKDLPAAIRRYSTIKLITVLFESRGGVSVFVWQTTNGVTRFSSKINYFDVGITNHQTLPFNLVVYYGLAASNSWQFAMHRETNGWKLIARTH